MRKTYTIILFIFLCSASMNAQIIEYKFDGTSWEGWLGGSGTGAFSSIFANNPNGQLVLTWPTTSTNAIMYAPGTFDASTYKYVQIRINNTSTQINQFRIRSTDGTFFNAADQVITTNTTNEYTIYNVQITNVRWSGNLIIQAIFRKSDNSAITDGGTVKVDNIAISTTPLTTTWNGINWSNGAPTATMEAIIAGVYSTASNGSINSNYLTINSGSLTINSGTNVTVTNEVINNVGTGAFIIENNANLVQTKSVGNTTGNRGNTLVYRNSNDLKRLDYTIWSSPVNSTNQFLTTFSPLTVTSRFYNYDNSTNFYTEITSPSTTLFSKGSGYLIRMPDQDPANLGTGTTYYNGTSSLTYNGQFSGVLNNGTITTPITYLDATHPYNMVGNPYPSTVNMTQFVTENSLNIESTLYFWRKTNGAGTAYCTWTPAVTPATGTFVTNGNAQSVDPLGVLQTSQGFFVEAKPGATSLTFNNGQRVANNAGQFFKTKQIVDAGRVWLNATNAAGDFSQMAVTYSAQGTQGIDMYDGKSINDSKFALTSIINNEEYTIQGRPVFTDTDEVALNFKTEMAGTYTIAKDHADGLFATGQDVFLVDATTGKETNLQTDAYTFTAPIGVNNSRFKLTYKTTGALKVIDQVIDANSISVYKQNGVLSINAGNTTMKNVKVFDIQGRLILEQNGVNDSTTTLKNIPTGKQALLIQITTNENKVVTKKAMN